jgi:hypothetical protein
VDQRSCPRKRRSGRRTRWLRGSARQQESKGTDASSLSCIGPPLSPRVVPLWSYHAGYELTHAGPAALEVRRRAAVGEPPI